MITKYHSITYHLEIDWSLKDDDLENLVQPVHLCTCNLTHLHLPHIAAHCYSSHDSHGNREEPNVEGKTWAVMVKSIDIVEVEMLVVELRMMNLQQRRMLGISMALLGDDDLLCYLLDDTLLLLLVDNIWISISQIVSNQTLYILYICMLLL